MSAWAATTAEARVGSGEMERNDARSGETERARETGDGASSSSFGGVSNELGFSGDDSGERDFFGLESSSGLGEREYDRSIGMDGTGGVGDEVGDARDASLSAFMPDGLVGDVPPTLTADVALLNDEGGDAVAGEPAMERGGELTPRLSLPIPLPLLFPFVVLFAL